MEIVFSVSPEFLYSSRNSTHFLNGLHFMFGRPAFDTLNNNWIFVMNINM